MYYKYLYDAHKALRRCVRCGKQDSYTLVGRAHCYECLQTLNDRSKDNQVKFKEKISARKKSKYQERKENGLCVGCGKSLDIAGKSRCSRCLAKQKIAQKKHRDKTSQSVSFFETEILGLCTTCRKNPRFDNHKLCQECYEKTCKILNSRKSNTDKSNHPWMLDEKIRRANTQHSGYKKAT